MKDKIRMAATVLPVLLVPLIRNRKEIKEHPDVKKLAKNSNILYDKVKDKAQVVTEVGATGYNETRDFISSKYQNSKQKHAYNKQIKDYNKLQKELEKLEADFEKDKDAHRNARLEKETVVSTPSSEELESRMQVSKGSQKLNIQKPDTKNVRELNERFVEGTEYEESYEPGSLHRKHKDALDPKSARLREENKDLKEQREASRDESLFGKHRRENERHIQNIGRKTGYGEAYQKPDSLREFQDWKEKHNN